MASYLYVKDTKNSTHAYELYDTASKPYICVSTKKCPLTSTVSTYNNVFFVKKDNTLYVPYKTSSSVSEKTGVSNSYYNTTNWGTTLSYSYTSNPYNSGYKNLVSVTTIYSGGNVRYSWSCNLAEVSGTSQYWSIGKYTYQTLGTHVQTGAYSYNNQSSTSELYTYLTRSSYSKSSKQSITISVEAYNPTKGSYSYGSSSYTFSRYDSLNLNYSKSWIRSCYAYVAQAFTESRTTSNVEIDRYTYGNNTYRSYTSTTISYWTNRATWSFSMGSTNSATNTNVYLNYCGGYPEGSYMYTFYTRGTTQKTIVRTSQTSQTYKQVNYTSGQNTVTYTSKYT